MEGLTFPDMHNESTGPNNSRFQPRIVYVRTRPVRQDGQRIFDDRLVSAIGEMVDDLLTVLEYDGDTGISYHAGKAIAKPEKSRILESSNCIILSSLDTFEFSRSDKRVLIHHDVPHEAYRAMGGVINRVKSMYLKRRVLSQIRCSPFNFFISEREFQKYRFTQPAARLYVGMNVDAAALFPNTFTRSILITGNYRWSLKQQSLKNALDCLTKANTDVFYDSHCPIGRRILLDSTSEVIFAEKQEDSLSFGLISDHFESGFKLKSLELIRKNCVILSFVDMSSEFRDIDNSTHFIRHVHDSHSLERAMLDIESLGDELIPMFEKFRVDVERKFNWRRSAAILMDEIRALSSTGLNTAHTLDQ